MTTSWYKKFYTDKKKIEKFSMSQIHAYEQLMEKRL